MKTTVRNVFNKLYCIYLLAISVLQQATKGTASTILLACTYKMDLLAFLFYSIIVSDKECVLGPLHACAQQQAWWGGANTRMLNGGDCLNDFARLYMHIGLSCPTYSSHKERFCLLAHIDLLAFLGLQQ